jgi:hypothetical protein
VDEARKEGYDGEVIVVPHDKSGTSRGAEGKPLGKKGDETVGIFGNGCVKSGAGRFLRKPLLEV